MPATTIRWTNPTFLRAYEGMNNALRQYPCAVFCGRSNVGKSSVINALCNGRFAHVSRTPGRTQTINIYHLPPLFFADLPGYGYAAVAQKKREQWGQRLTEFLQHAPIRLVVLIVDCRRGLLPLDEQLLALCEPRGMPIHILLNKADKLSRTQQQKMLAETTAAAGLPATLFSATAKTGVAAARQIISQHA